MIRYVNSNITTVERGVIAHGCNTLGKFGAGVAKDIRERWPRVYDVYMRNAKLGEQLLGSANAVRVDDNLWVVNCYTQPTIGKRGTGRHAQPDAIRRSLEAAFLHATAYGLPLHAPRIGCDLGGLDWENEVLPIFDHLNSIYEDVDVFIHIRR